MVLTELMDAKGAQKINSKTNSEGAKISIKKSKHNQYDNKAAVKIKNSISTDDFQSIRELNALCTLLLNEAVHKIQKIQRLTRPEINREWIPGYSMKLLFYSLLYIR